MPERGLACFACFLQSTTHNLYEVKPIQTAAHSQARSVLCPGKQREGQQKERLCCGRTGVTAPASPAAEHQKYITMCTSEGAGDLWNNTGVRGTGIMLHGKNRKRKVMIQVALTWSRVALWDRVCTHSSIRRTRPDFTSLREYH